MGYKLVIRENNIDEGALEDYYNQLARQQGIKTPRKLGIDEPGNKVPSAAERIAAYKANKASEAEKQAAVDAKNAEKARKAAEKQAAADEKERPRQALANAKRELESLTVVTQQMRDNLRLSDAVIQGALEQITNGYINSRTLAEVENTLTPPPKSQGRAEFKKYYPSTLDPNIFVNFSNINQIVEFIYLYQVNLQGVQEKIKSITGGKMFKVKPELARVFELNNGYREQLTSAQIDPERQKEDEESRLLANAYSPEDSNGRRHGFLVKLIDVDDDLNNQLKAIFKNTKKERFELGDSFAFEPSGGSSQLLSLFLKNRKMFQFIDWSGTSLDYEKVIQQLKKQSLANESIYDGVFSKFLIKEYKTPLEAFFKLRSNGSFILK